MHIPRLVVSLALCLAAGVQPACHTTEHSVTQAPNGSAASGGPATDGNSYGVGGVTWGLLANTTVRLINGNDTLNVGNTSFVFASRVPDGGDYNVTVATQPGGQICVVSAGQGSVQGATVTNVQVVCTPAALSVGGTVSGLQALTAVTLTESGAVLSLAADGAFTLPVGYAPGNDYNVQVWAHPAGAHCTLAENAGVLADANVTNVAITCAAAARPDYTFSTNQPAAVEIGQPNFGSASTTLLRGPATLWTTDRFDRYPYKAFAIPGGPLYLPDFWNYRVLVFNGLPATNFADADSVIGADNLTDQGDGTIYPMAVSGGPGYLAVTNQQSYTSIFTYVGFPVVDPCQFVVTGKIDYDCTQQGAGAIGYSDVAIFENKLLAMDRFYNRLLIWDPQPTDPTQRIDPSSVFGQGDFNACTPQTTGSGFSNPTGFYADANVFIVADSNNNRVLIWNQSISNLSAGTQASLVLGQNDFLSTDNVGPGATGFTPNSVDSDGTMLVVTDMVNNRVLVWHTMPQQNNQPADVVLGQQNFTDNSCNQSATSGTFPQAQTLCHPTGANIAGPFIIVNDTGNLRFSIFRAQ